MDKKVNYSGLVAMVLAVAVLVMSIGFATFSQNLTINGTANVSTASWQIQFDADSYAETSGSVTTTPTINATTVTYTVDLQEPGQFYEFTIDVENQGTFDANLTSLTMTTLTTTQSNYLTYTVTYGSTSYTTSQSSLSISLASGSSETVKVRVEYIQPDDSSLLPSSTEAVTLALTLGYEQAA